MGLGRHRFLAMQRGYASGRRAFRVAGVGVLFSKPVSAAGSGRFGAVAVGAGAQRTLVGRPRVLAGAGSGTFAVFGDALGVRQPAALGHAPAARRIVPVGWHNGSHLSGRSWQLFFAPAGNYAGDVRRPPDAGTAQPHPL